MKNNLKIKRALLSVSNKEGLVDFARVLKAFDVEILSTGGTAEYLRQNDIDIIEISDYTGFPEIMGGRVKTLHPKVHGGILGRRDVDAAVMQTHHISPIDLVVVNLYPFEKVIQDPQCSLEEAIENIDIGGPTLIRAAAKNHLYVTVVTDPNDYTKICEALGSTDNGIDFDLRFSLAQKAFAKTAAYDAAITNYLSRSQSDDDFPQVYLPSFYKKSTLRYGENPQQTAAIYTHSTIAKDGLANAKQIQGKELSYNNLADADAALSCVEAFNNTPACVIVKHANPCGIAIGQNILDAYQKAFATDTKSAFGGIIAFNQMLDAKTLDTILQNQFVEVIVAPQIETEALAIAKKKPNVRLLISQQSPLITAVQKTQDYMYKTISGGLLVQTMDRAKFDPAQIKIATQQQPTEAMLKDLFFAWAAVKYVKSNAIVLVKDQQTIGIGAGQMSRIDSAEIAFKKAQEVGFKVEGTVMASDAFFPFRDVVDIAAKYGVSAIIQPGGSLRDEEVIQAANEAGLVMVLTGVRHFLH
jgi:phosphoribosylaminoimidazolecarboxamide formyltransferase/IMP cyclohydrolase